MNITSPVHHQDRSSILDVLRGFALFGVLFANSAVFSLYVFLEQKDQKLLSTHTADNIIRFIHFALIDGRFYSLFSLLFGIGFSIILIRNQNAGRNGLLLFYRRLLLLIIIGALHITFGYDGDILLLYALIGCLLPFFRNLSDKTLVIIAIALILSPLLFDLVKVLSNGRLNMATPFRAKGEQLDILYGIKGNEGKFLAEGAYDKMLLWLKTGFYWRIEHLLESNRIPKVLAMFLLGYVVGRRLIYAKLEENKNLLAKITHWGFGVGLPASIAYAYFTFDNHSLPSPMGLTDTGAYVLSVIPLSLAYTATICMLWMKKSWKNKLQILAPLGRMALTNYLAQTIICSFIYFGFGLGLGGKVGPSIYLLITIAIYIFQISYSTTWLKYFNYGPAEWIWRQLTYGKRFPLRKKINS